ncbi:MAG: DNA recombination protein RmuC [Deferrisomatales bacterium]|nr:DNA recombination protein RmuC [Deferrisomatales bacterium]
MPELLTPESLLLVLALVPLGVAVAVAAARASRRGSRRLAELEERLGTELDRLRSALETALREGLQGAGRAQGDFALQVTGRLEESRSALLENLSTRFQQLQNAQGESLHRLQGQVAADLERLRRDSEVKLEKIRATVEEKLHATLETRLGASFRLVSERLEQVHRGLGEMQALASGVGDLKRVLTNVRSRGTFGEVQLEALLEQVLSPSQFDRNAATVPGSRDRVEFAVRLPGRDDDGSVVYLPIDAKFPQEDYLRLQEAYEAGDGAAAEEARRALRGRLLAEGAAIRAKYLAPPHTTDFGLLFVPTEGLYAEALRMPGLVEALQRQSQVVLVGPTTLYAVLNSLQMGFRTLAIEKRSGEVWRILGAVKGEFEKFGDSLAEVRKKLQEAGNKIDFSERRSRVLQRTLKEVESLPEGDARALLPEGPEEEP